MYGTKKHPCKVLLTPFGSFIPWGTDLPEYDDWDHEDWYIVLMSIVVDNQLYMDVGVHQIKLAAPVKVYFHIHIPTTFYVLKGDGTYLEDVPQYPYEAVKDNTYFVHTLS